MLGLNNKGWGFSTMVVCITVIVIALLVATFYSIRLYSQLNKSLIVKNEDNNQIPIKFEDYYKMEDILEKASSQYISDLGINLSEISYNVNYDTLKTHGYIEEFVDTKTFKECTGYAIVYNNKHSDAFIKCDSYISKGYVEQ